MQVRSNKRAQRYFIAAMDYFGKGYGVKRKSVAIRIANHLTRGVPKTLNLEEESAAWYVRENIRAGEYAEVGAKKRSVA